MTLFSRPLVALSLTEPDAALLRYAALATLGGQCEEIRFVHVERRDGIAPDGDEVRALRERMQSEVQSHFGASQAPARFDVVCGSRLDQLLTVAARQRNDVILLGHRRGRRGSRSLARRLAMAAPCSVWLHPEGATEQISAPLVPVDFSSHSADALALATALAAARRIEVCLALHVFFDPSSVQYPEHRDEVFSCERSDFDAFIANIDRHGVHVEPLYEESTHPAEAILRVAARQSADLIVMNTRGRTRAAAVLLGSVTSDTMGATTIPLLAVKHFGNRETLLEVLLNQRFWRAPSPKTN